MERGLERKEEKAKSQAKEQTNEPSSLVTELRKLLCNDSLNLKIMIVVIILLCGSCAACYFILDEK